MKFEIFQAPYRQTYGGYDQSADYEPVWAGEVDDLEVLETTEATPALERIFRDFQRVDPDLGSWPPEGYTGRSLSVGDVVVLDGWAPFAVENLGFAAAVGFRVPSARA